MACHEPCVFKTTRALVVATPISPRLDESSMVWVDPPFEVVATTPEIPGIPSREDGLPVDVSGDRMGPPFISHEVRPFKDPFGRGPTTRSLGDEI